MHFKLLFIFTYHITNKQINKCKAKDKKQRDLQNILDVPQVQKGYTGAGGHSTGAAEQGEVQVQSQEDRQGFEAHTADKSP